MGRYYWGDIEGKFWFACQSSNDVENICCITCFPTYFYRGCDCIKNNGDEDYCTNCYEDFEEHQQKLEIDSQNEDPFVKGDKLWYENESIIKYYIELEDLHEIQESIEELNDIIGQYIEVLTFKKEDKGYEYDFEFTYAYKNLESDVQKPKDKLIARYCLARQIELCLLKKGECSMTCEC
jgi:hypothetical protein